MKRWIAILFAAMMTVPAWASPPQDATIEKLLELTQAQKSADSAVADADAFLKSTVIPMTEREGVPAEKREAAKKCLEDYRKMIHDTLGWESLKPEYVRIYRESFTEEELKDLTAFYQTPTGRMLIEKTPVLESKLGAALDQRMKSMMERMHPTCVGAMQ
ncbi:MAG: DUF2059 domain-containing protein [Oxalobacter sp.]|jgi:hypothetical protein|nr:DUF2059 domain-containing protein [Oxalobacter sp.]